MKKSSTQKISSVGDHLSGILSHELGQKTPVGKVAEALLLGDLGVGYGLREDEDGFRRLCRQLRRSGQTPTVTADNLN